MNLKHLLIPGAVCFVVAFSTVQADDRHHPEQGRMSSQAASSPGMSMMNMEQMQEQMQSMQDTMNRVQKTDDPEERMRLVQQHMTQMHEMMGNMRGMMGPEMMMGSGTMMPGDAKGKMDAGKMGNMSMDERQGMMERRLDMMQQMMEQMMEQLMMMQQGSGRGMNK